MLTQAVKVESDKTGPAHFICERDQWIDAGTPELNLSAAHLVMAGGGRTSDSFLAGLEG